MRVPAEPSPWTGPSRALGGCRSQAGLQGLWLSVLTLASTSACLSVVAPPPHPNPSSGYVQAAGLKSDPGGRRPFLLIRDRDTLPQPPPAQPDPHLSQAPMSWGHLLPWSPRAEPLFSEASPGTKGNSHGLPGRSHSTRQRLRKRLFPARAGRRGAWERRHVQERFIQNCRALALGQALCRALRKQTAGHCSCPCPGTCPQKRLQLGKEQRTRG